MKQFIYSFLITIITIGAYAQMDMPPAGFNPRATISEEVGITGITIKYSRPGVKGREGKIWGSVVPNGLGNMNFLTGRPASPWRAGANEATVINFEHDVKVEGQDLKAGSYAIYMAMGADNVTIIFSKQTEAWGSFYYKEADDVLKVNVKPLALDKSVEWLKYEFIEHRENSCVIALQWEKLSVPFKVEVDVENIVLARMREEFIGVKGFISANRLQASMYWFNKNTHMQEALGWAQSAVTGKPFGQSGFSAYNNLANGYEKLNRLPEADSVMNEGLIIADLNQYMGYGRKLIQQKRINRAIEVLLGAKAKFGDIYAVNNRLSFAYSANGDYKKALKHANKALLQASSEQIKTRISGNIKKLKDRKDINQ